ncbi:unnamed protein product [Paramecium pentaurelia]|uniref:Uncharacterized protein n=1 Tax=Paramecium pentaurelia TaxID=43138 RepID=A0A8S1SLQ4_9CILI|nr:unnamed protein product [Paramecium pentaurelia]
MVIGYIYHQQESQRFQEVKLCILNIQQSVHSIKQLESIILFNQKEFKKLLAIFGEKNSLNNSQLKHLNCLQHNLDIIIQFIVSQTIIKLKRNKYSTNEIQLIKKLHYPKQCIIIQYLKQILLINSMLKEHIQLLYQNQFKEEKYQSMDNKKTQEMQEMLIINRQFWFRYIVQSLKQQYYNFGTTSNVGLDVQIYKEGLKMYNSLIFIFYQFYLFKNQKYLQILILSKILFKLEKKNIVAEHKLDHQMKDPQIFKDLTLTILRLNTKQKTSSSYILSYDFFNEILNQLQYENFF